MNRFIEYTGMRAIAALISFIMFIIFIMPFSRGIVNIGNCVGAIVTLMLTMVFIFFKPFISLVKSIWEKPCGKIFICILSFIIIICIVTATVISVLMFKAARDLPKGRETTLVVLGCKVKNGIPSKMLKYRLDAAYEYLVNYENVNVVVSGGQGDDEIISEAKCMRDYLVSRGISDDRIYMEDKSSNTEENLRFSKDIIELEGLCEKITIVSDGYHQLRAEMIAKNLGIESFNISADTTWWLIPTYWVREWFGIVHFGIFG